MYFSKCTSAGTSSQPNNRVLITIISLAVLPVIVGVFAVVYLIALTAYCKTRKNKEKTSKTSPNKDSLSNLRATENLATSNTLYDNPEGMKMISYAIC